MALLNPHTGEYLKIVGAVYDFVLKNYHYNYYIFANQEQRERYEQGLSPYEVFKYGSYNGIGIIQDVLNTNVVGNSVKDVIITSGYMCLKQDMYNEWVDV